MKQDICSKWHTWGSGDCCPRAPLFNLIACSGVIGSVMEYWDGRSKFWKLRGGGGISSYQQVLSTVAKRWHFLCLWQPSIPERSWLCRNHRSAALWLIRLCTLLLCAGTDWKPEFFPLVSLTGHKKMLCFLCISCFYLQSEGGGYLGVYRGN